MTVWPQYCVLAVYCTGLGAALAQKTDILLHIIATALMGFLLYEGGFFVSLGFAP